MGVFDMFGGGSEVEMPSLDDYMPLIQAQIDANRIDKVTPFGSLTYKTVGAQDPLSFDQWQTQNPTAPPPDIPSWIKGTPKEQEWLNNNQTRLQYNPQNAYQDYLNAFDPGGEQVAEFNFSPELRTLFDQQFNPDAYNQYEQDYMDRYYDLTNPYRQDQIDQFQQSMFDRGIPQGSEVYDDYYRPIGDQFSRADLMAAQAATGVADQRLMQDYNRLMTAMGGSALPVPNVDVMGPANMALNTNIAQAQADAAGSIWNTLPGLAGAYMMGAPDSSWIWGV